MENCLLDHKVNGEIWKVLWADQAKNKLCLLVNSEKAFSLLIIDLTADKMTVEEHPLPEDANRWLIQGVWDNHLVVQELHDVQNPVIKRILVFNYLNQEERLSISAAQFGFFKNGLIYLKQKGQWYSLDRDLNLKAEAATAPSENYLQQAATNYSDGHAYFETVSEFLREKKGIEAIGNINYLENEERVYISYYIWENTLLASYLLTIDQEGKEISLQKMNKNLDEANLTDTFFIQEEYLAYIGNKCRLQLFKLGSTNK